MTMLESVEATLARLVIADTDVAAAELARAYAAKLDDGGALDVLGPKLLDVLGALHATPRARSQAVKAGTAPAPTGSPLDELRRKRDARHGTA